MSNASSISSANSANLMDVSTLPSHNAHERKRIRTSKSCLVCRQKKVKCDKGKPACESCRKKGKPHLCKYEEPHWSVKVAKKDSSTQEQIQRQVMPSLHHPQQFGPENRTSPNIGSLSSTKDLELMSMNQRIKQLEEAVKQSSRFTDGLVSPYSTHDTSPQLLGNPDLPSTEQKDQNRHPLDDALIDFYHNSFTSPINVSQGALSWVSLLRKDVYLNSITLSTQKAKAILDKTSGYSTMEDDFIEKWEREDPSTDVPSNIQQVDASRTGLIPQLKDYLTDARLIWSLLDRFFESEFFLMVPVIDKDEFTNMLFDLIGSRGDSEVRLKLKKRSDLTTIGILLLIMRFTSLSAYNFGKKQFLNDAESQYICDHQVDITAIKLVHKIATEIEAFKIPSLETYQFLVLKIYYEFFGPEEGDCIRLPDSSKIGHVLQYGIQCTLNRDPNFTNNGLDSKKKNLMRRLWYNVVYLDTYQLMLVGCPPTIDSKFYDTHFPHLDESESEFDYTINEWFYERAKLYEVTYPLLMSILNVRVKSPIGQVKSHLKPILNYAEKLRSIGEVVKGPRDTLVQRCNKIKDLTYNIDVHSLLYMVYYHFFIFYNEKKDKEQSLVYLIEIVNISTKLFELILFLDPNATEYNLQKHFGNGAVIFPKIELVLHRITQFMFAILSRIKGFKAFTTELSSDVAKVVDDIADISTRTITHILVTFVNISDTYYHPWVVSKVQAFILSKILNVPKGTKYSTKTPADFQFLKSLNRSRKYDEMFHHYTLNDFMKIRDAFENFDVISKTSGSDFANKSKLSQELANENDKRWLDQMLNDYNFGITETVTALRDYGLSSEIPGLSFCESIDIGDGVELGLGTGSSGVSTGTNSAGERDIGTSFIAGPSALPNSYINGGPIVPERDVLPQELNLDDFSLEKILFWWE